MSPHRPAGPPSPAFGAGASRSVSTPRLALSVEEAAAALSLGRTAFYESVLPELRIVRVGRRRLVPVAELERFLAENAARPLADELRGAA